MFQLIRKFCDDGSGDRNILLIDMPTGTGKTHSVLDYIADYLVNNGEKKIFFITSLKKNLPVHALENRLKKEHQELFDQYVMDIPPLAEAVIDGYKGLKYNDKMNIKSIVPDEYITLESHLECIFDAKEANVKKNVMETLTKQFEIIERNFRKAVREALKKEKSTAKERLKLISTEKWNWVGKLYPSAYTSNKKVFFMSVDKFLVTHDTIVDNAYRFYESKFIENSIIFIDEFDSSKDTMLKSIARSESEKVECIRMFKTIRRTLLEREKEHRKAYYIPSEFQVNKYGGNALVKFADEVLDKAESIYKKFNLGYSFKINGDPQSNFIFHDFKSHNIAQGRQISIESDCKEQVNFLEIRDESSDDPTISRLFSSLYGFFRYFEALIESMAKSHMELERKKGNDIAYEDAISTMLDLYDFTYDQHTFIKHAILFNSNDEKSKVADDDDLSVYNNGFSFYRFEDSTEHNLSSKLFLTAYSRTPEKILLTVLSKEGTKVVGISATASLPSAVGNFDLNYLRYRPEFKIYEKSEGDKNRLKARFKQSISGYGEVKIDPILIDGETLELSDVFSDKDNVLMASNVLEGSKDYVRKRYLKVLKAYREFLTRNIQSMVCFLNILPGNELFSPSILDDLFNRLIEEIGDAPDELRASPYETVQSAEFEENKRHVLEKLSKGDKVFILTTYATVGAGQNLQYDCPKGSDLVEINDHEDEEGAPLKKDIDAIYLDEPTNIIPRVEKDNWESLAKAIFTIEFLMEHNEFSPRRAFDMIRVAFLQCNGIEAKNRHKMKDKESIRMTYARIVIQAIGRMCRTKRKNKNIHIFADKNLEKVFDFKIPLEEYGQLRNPEFDVLYNKLKFNYLESNESTDEVKPGNYASELAHRHIHGFLGVEWNEAYKAKWIKLRQLVLKHPTIAEGEGGPLVNSLYLKLGKPANKVRYSEENDYGYVVISPNGSKVVSSEAARLEQMLALPNIRKLFEENGYATHFEENDRIMSPPLFNNIYKGALGEVVGKQILSDWGINTEELGISNYERFDYKISDSAYVDFKNWAGPMEKDRKSCLEEIFEKIRKLNGKRAYIINIISTGRNEKLLVREKSEDGLEIVEVPFLFDSDMIRNKEAYSELCKEAVL